jgi:CO/xanthine dehydrogenase Mo-binding subunit
LTTHAFVALATLKTGRPARLALRRAESLRYHPKKHGYEMKYRIAATKDGKLLGMDFEILSDAGAYTSWTTRVIEQSVAFGTGPYYVPALRGKGTGVFTNNLVMGAMRGFGANQVHFACESALDMLSRKLEMDPIALRQKNALELGLPMSTGQILREGVGFKKTLETIRPLVESELLPLKQAEKDVGIGIASGWRSVAGGLGPDEGAGASLELEKDGKVLLKVACTEMGQGSHTALCQIVSDVLKVKICDIRVLAGDTKLVPEGGGVMASRGVYLWGHATAEASKKFRNLVLENGARILELNERQIDLIDGYIVGAEGKEKLLSLSGLASRIGKPLAVDEFYMLGKTFPILEDANESLSIDPEYYKTHHTIAYNTTAVAVKVDRKKGDVYLLHAIVALDCGNVINPEAARTQVEGAVIMGMGYAVSEKFIIERGVNKTNTLGKCRIPKITSVPRKITTIFVDNPDPTGPFESKGVAEMGILAITPAITNAIYDAVGVRVKTLPAQDVLKTAREE